MDQSNFQLEHIVDNYSNTAHTPGQLNDIATPGHLLKPNLFALIIGIDDYFYAPRLRGAIADAIAVKDYLEEFLRVPQNHICTLLGREATRDAIIKAFHELRNDRRINRGDPIVIFYAGHGGELPAPLAWGKWGLETMVIQCIIPQDYHPNTTHSIPDRTIGALIEDIAKVRGDNITVILDCCHSASGTRIQNDEYVPRTVALDPNIPDDLDRDIWGGRAGTIASGFACHGLRSHVLLAACGEKEVAYEHEGRGQFTSALLEVLKKFTADELTYDQLREHMAPLNKQNPHFEGIHRHRVLFDSKMRAGSQVFYSVCIGGDGQYVIGAGSAHGVSEGVEFTLYSGRRLRLGKIVVDGAAVIKNFETAITMSVHLAEPSFAKLTRVGKLSLYVTPGGTFSCVLGETFRKMDDNGTNTPRLRFVQNVEEGHVEVAMEDGVAVLNVIDQRLRKFGQMELSFKVALKNLAHALSAAAHYYWYLDNCTRQNNRISTKHEITVDFYLLQESDHEYDDYGMSLLVPLEPGFCRKDSNSDNLDVIDFVVDPNALYGIKITNDTPWDLYLNAFLFNNSDLSIAPYYTQPCNPDVPLKRKGTFTIGYGPGGTAPFSYSLEEGLDVDIGYLKIFFATRPIDLSDIVQTSPFLNNTQPFIDGEERKSGAVSPFPRQSVDIWFTIVIPVVQRRK